ncbi:MAG: SIMPL domain-containing protein [Candidatus Micrarchaeota archaeon]
MAKENTEAMPQRGFMLVAAALFMMVGMLGSAYMLAQVDYSPTVNVEGGPTNPTVYVSSTPPDHAISVSATASEKVAPDLLNLQLRVQTDSSNAAESQSENAQVTAELKTELEKLGLEDKAIQTTSYNVYPVYDSEYVCDGGNKCRWDSVLTGYRTVHSLNVEVTQLDMGGEIIDAASTAGVNQTFVDYVDFTLKPETRRTLEKALLKEASAETRSKAQEIASGLGVAIGSPLTVSESFSYPYYPAYRGGVYMAEAADYAAPTSLSPGQVEVSATVSTSFAIQ